MVGYTLDLELGLFLRHLEEQGIVDNTFRAYIYYDDPDFLDEFDLNDPIVDCLFGARNNPDLRPDREDDIIEFESESQRMGLVRLTALLLELRLAIYNEEDDVQRQRELYDRVKEEYTQLVEILESIDKKVGQIWKYDQMINNNNNAQQNANGHLPPQQQNGNGHLPPQQQQNGNGHLG